MSDKVRLQVLGLSYARLKNSAYMLILRQVDGPYHINMWIGEAEAHSIAIAMEGLKPPRPLTHDLFTSFIHAFGVKLKEVFIYKVDEEIFSSELTFTDGERTVTIDSRTSDGIAIAMRTGAPIYTTRQIIEEKGFLLEVRNSDENPEEPEEGSVYEDDDEGYAPDFDSAEEESIADEEPQTNYIPRLEQYSVEELERTLNKLIESEQYEQAAKVNEILQRKKGERGA